MDPEFFRFGVFCYIYIMKKLIDLLFGRKPKVEVKPIDRTPLYKELHTQSIKNVNYLRASINTMNGVVNYVKGESISETRLKKARMQNQINWMKEKLVEEEAMVKYYGSLIG